MIPGVEYQNQLSLIKDLNGAHKGYKAVWDGQFKILNRLDWIPVELYRRGNRKVNVTFGASVRSTQAILPICF